MNKQYSTSRIFGEDIISLNCFLIFVTDFGGGPKNEAVGGAICEEPDGVLRDICSRHGED